MRTYDRPVLLRRALLDVLDQTFADWHLSLINNGGQPAEVDALVAEFADRFDGRITVTHADRLPMESATNAAIAASPKTRYINVHDDDDTWHPDFLMRTIGVLDAAGNQIAAAVTRSDYVSERIEDDGSITELERRAHNPNLIYVSLSDMFGANPVAPIAVVLRREIYDALGGFDERFTTVGDWDMLIRVLRDYEIIAIPESLTDYRHRVATDGSYTNTVSNQSQMDANVAMVRDKFLRDALTEGRIDLAHLVAAISPVDRDTFALAAQLHQWVYDLQLLVGDIDQRLREVHEFAIAQDVPLRRLNRIFNLLARVRHPLRRV